ncbi:unnamed protein product [Strongylus vulgaris]|uniref:Peptidase M14 domain-containing protein n=1 Tax=Strongylus vulgaris TaxID=40348 RepID=A0A3P7J6N8_STRVU|nr:unnamed protein product [Strongylus vulgaris]
MFLALSMLTLPFCFADSFHSCWIIILLSVSREIRRERRHLQRYRSRAKRSFDAMQFDVDNYHTYDEVAFNIMVEFMQLLSKQHPDLVTLLNVSRTFEGRPMYGVKVRVCSKKTCLISSSNRYKPAIFVDAGVHAREWAAPAAALWMIKKVLVSAYGKDPVITRSVDKFDWYIIPEANPDGYEYSRVSDRLWRKTRSRNITVNKWCVGADANRNWGHRWGEAGANRSPCSNIYAGSRPFSEPEIVGNGMRQKLLSMLCETRREQSTSMERLPNPASGTSIDYMQDRGVPYIFGVELRPLDSHDTYGFSLPPQLIKPTGERTTRYLLLCLSCSDSHGGS